MICERMKPGESFPDVSDPPFEHDVQQQRIPSTRRRLLEVAEMLP
jgi:hypothetical protein